MITAITITLVPVPGAENSIPIFNIEVEGGKMVYDDDGWVSKKRMQTTGVWAETLHESQVAPFLRGLQAGVSTFDKYFFPAIHLPTEADRPVRMEFDEHGICMNLTRVPEEEEV